MFSLAICASPASWPPANKSCLASDSLSLLGSQSPCVMLCLICCVFHCISIECELVSHSIPHSPWFCSEEMIVLFLSQMSVLVPLFCYGLSLFTLHRNYCVCAGISLFPCNKSKPTMKQVQSACTHLSSCSALNKGVRQRAFMGFVRIWCETALKCFRCKVEQFMPVYQCCLFVQHKWETCATLSALTVLSSLAMAPCPVRATFFLFHTNSHFSVSGGMPCHSLPASVVRHVILLSNAPQTSP